MMVQLTEHSPTHTYYLDFADGDVEGDVASGTDSDHTCLIGQQPNRAPKWTTVSASSTSRNDLGFSDSSKICHAAAEVDAWALGGLQWFVANMKSLLLYHLPECIAWIPFAIDSLQHEQDQPKKIQLQVHEEYSSWKHDDAGLGSPCRVPAHPGVFWSTEL